MNKGVATAVAALVIGAAASCSSEPAPFKPGRGTLPPGTAQLTINGTEVDTTGAVQCAPIESLTTIKVGDEASGATTMISNAKGLTVEFVRIRNLTGFTGDYDLGLQGKAAVAMTGSTYHITGAAFGYRPKSFEPTLEPFAIKVAC
ncbi:MAG: lipoprotein LpqH [Mycobacterium sp.]